MTLGKAVSNNKENGFHFLASPKGQMFMLLANSIQILIQKREKIPKLKNPIPKNDEKPNSLVARMIYKSCPLAKVILTPIHNL